MDTLTHALSGALLARALAPAAPREDQLSLRGRLVAGFLSAAAPDLDFVVAFFGQISYLLAHRGVTHSVLMLPLWAWLLAWTFAKLARDARGWRPWYGVSAMGIALHIAGDLITSYGTMIFAPFSGWRAGIGTTFIIDLWFSGIIIAGLMASLVWRRARLPALVASFVLVSYVGAQWTLKQRALDVGERLAAARNLRDVRIDAQARPPSPFNWTVFVSDVEAHRYAHVNVVRDTPHVPEPGAGILSHMHAAYLPAGQAQWSRRARYGDEKMQTVAREAWNSDALAFFRWFAELPAFDGATGGSTCVWFVDLRFLTPGRGAMPFRYGACREAPGEPWRAYTRTGDGAVEAAR